MLKRKRPRVVSLDEVKIIRRGDSAEFDYADEAMGSMSLELGVDISDLSDDELLERHNEVVRSMEAAAASYEHVAVEIPPGKPQLRYSRRSEQWSPRGDVVRCIVHDGGPEGEAVVEVDDRELTLREFGRMMTTYAGWGMRIVFVPDDELHLDPVIEVREPDDAEPAEPPEETMAQVSPRSMPRQAAATRPPRPRSSEDRARLVDRMPIYQLRITLLGTEPPVWRTVRTSGNVALKKLHQIIQIAMGWTDSHLHLFASNDGKDMVSDPRAGLDHTRDEARVKLRSFAAGIGGRFRYEYDFGDSWIHDVLVEEILSPEESGRWPRCVDGARACPPEDCGGVGGYQDLLAAMKNRAHPDRKHYLDWLGAEFLPEQFEVDAINRQLGSLK